MTLFTGHLVSSNPNDSPFTQANPSAPKVPIYIAAGTLSASFVTVPVPVEHLYGFSITAVMSGSTVNNITGTVGVFGSNDLVPLPVTSNRLPGNWVQIADALGNVARSNMSGSQTTMFNAQQQYYRFVQVQYTHTGGTGSLDIFMTGKGNNI